MHSRRAALVAVLAAVFTLLASGFAAKAGAGSGNHVRYIAVGHRSATAHLVHIANKGLVLGGFNENRGGQGSLQDPAVAGLKAAIAGGFPGVRFKFGGKLTPAFLATVNVVLLGVIRSSTSGIKPLSKHEQQALVQFVGSGGAALIFTDNDSFSSSAAAVNKSLLAPFGIRAKGTLNGNQIANFVGSNNPVQNGPFGTAAELDTFYPGWFASLGSCTELAMFATNGKPGLCYFPANHGSGAAIFFADSSFLLDAYRTADDTTAILNALALAP